ncbi:MAG: hypothetical protein KDB02_08925 [Acidimicrobiales bacterium]|nr:hypothetical protein [Acidimicrobiales bacterium]
MTSALSASTGSIGSESIVIPPADLAAIEGLRRLHLARVAAGPKAPVVDADASALGAPVDEGTETLATCPIPGFMRGKATTCPVGPSARSTEPVERGRADRFVRRLLRIPDRRVDLSDASTYRAFQKSMCISAVRCTLTYVIFPFVLPGISFLKGVGPVVGILIGTFALGCDTLTVRRFFAVDHKYRWHFSTIVFGIMCLLTVLLVQDISHVVSEVLS